MLPALPQTISRSIDRHGLEALPLWRYEGKIILLRDGDSAREAVEKLRRERHLGFDTETRPSFRKGQHYDPALVQLAAADAVYIFQLPLCGGVECLFPLFESERPLKVCLGVADDVRHLRAVVDFAPRGFLELGDVAKMLGVEDRSLKKLCGNLLGVRISKKEQTSNWAREELTEGQLRYAATDAWVGRRIYEVALELHSRGVAAAE
jgi:ribonuclease D